MSIPTLNLLIIVVRTFTNYKIYYCDNCPPAGHRLTTQLRTLINNPTLTQALPVSESPCCSYNEATKQSTPKILSFKLFNKKSQTQETEEHPYSVITTADRPRPTGKSPTPLYPTISNPIWTYQSQALIHQTQAQQQPNQINIQALLPSSGFLANTPLQPPTNRPAPPRTPQPELINYSNTPQFSTQPIIFANADKTSSSELPELIHIVLNINNTPQDTGLISDTSSSDPLSSQFSSPTPSKLQEIPLIHHKDH